MLMSLHDLKGAGTNPSTCILTKLTSSLLPPPSHTMDDWGTSVWDTADPIDLRPPAATTTILAPPPLTPPPITPLTAASDGFNDFDEFGEDLQMNTNTGMDMGGDGEDDFGDDFGDFGDGEVVEGFGEQQQETFALPTQTVTGEWEPLRLDPLPTPQELAGMVEEILDTVWKLPDPGEVMTSEDIRQVEGLNQILVTPERFVPYQ